jgi:hypothetical protein
MFKRLMNFLTVIFVALTIVVGLFGEKEGAIVFIFLLAFVGGLNYVFFGKLTFWNKDE